MSVSRREFVAGSAAALALTGCDGLSRYASNWLGAGVPERFAPPTGGTVDPIHHVLCRAAYGPRPGDVERVRAMGLPAWIEEQLAPDAIDDTASEIRLSGMESLRQPVEEMPEWRREVVWRELAAATVRRAVYSKRQLLEVMVGFWTDHFNISADKDGCDVWKTCDDRDVIRRHALGKFRDLVGASARSPAMLVYLDQRDNKVRKPDEKPNENYARELLELHTLGVRSGYTQHDVMEVARALSGWTVHRSSGWMARGTQVRGRPHFDPRWHDLGEKKFLGHTIPALAAPDAPPAVLRELHAREAGTDEMDQVLDVVSRHPATATYLSTKLCRRFVADAPPAALVARVAAVFTRTAGDIREVLRTILGSPEFAASTTCRLKRPFAFVVSALRGVGADTDGGGPVLDTLTRMGQAPFRYPTPDGYPDEAGPWLGTLLWRWRFAVRLATGRLNGTTVDLPRLARAAGDPGDGSALARHLLGRDWTADERDAVAAAAGSDPAIGGDEGAHARRRVTAITATLLASPCFQRC